MQNKSNAPLNTAGRDRPRCTTFVIAMLLAIAMPGITASHTWTGNGANGFWSTAANWENNLAPSANESPAGLVFPAAANRRTSTNNLAGLQVIALLMDGAAYSLRGAGAGTNITLLPGGYFGTIIAASGTGHTLDGSLNFTLTGTNLFAVGGGATLGVAGRLMGNGSFRKVGEGSLRLRPGTSNSFAGVTEVAMGTLELAAASLAIPGSLLVGETNSSSPASVHLFASEQIASLAPVTVHANGAFLLNAFNETVGALTVIGGVVDTGGGVLSPESITGIPLNGSAGDISGAIQLKASATNILTVLGDFYSRMDVHAQLRGGTGNALAALEKRGPGQAYLYASNSHHGPTIIRQGGIFISNPSGLGPTNFGTTVLSNGMLYLSHVHVSGEAVSLAAGGVLQARGSSWAGPVQLDGHATILVEDVSPNAKTLTLFGQLSGPGGFSKRGQGVLLLNGTAANTYEGRTQVEEGELQLGNGPGFNVPAIPGPLKIGGSSPQSPKRVVSMGPRQLSTNCVLWCDSTGTMDVQNFAETVAGLIVNNGGRLTGTVAGALTLNGPLLATNSANSSITASLQLGSRATNLWVATSPLTIEGALADAGSSRWEKLGAGNLILKGGGTYSGLIRIVEGNATVQAHLPMTFFDVVQPHSLYGTGQVARVNLQGGWLHPTEAVHPFRVGQLLSSSAGFIELNAVDAMSYARLACGTQPKLDGKIGLIFNTGNYNPAEGQSFMLLQNDSALPVSGPFKDLPEGSVLAVGSGRHYRLTYQGGDGNDVVLTRIAPPIAATLRPPAKLPGGTMQLSASGTPGAWYQVQASENLGNPVAWHPLGFAMTQPNGNLSFTDTNALNFPVRFYRFSDKQP